MQSNRFWLGWPTTDAARSPPFLTDVFPSRAAGSNNFFRRGGLGGDYLNDELADHFADDRLRYRKQGQDMRDVLSQVAILQTLPADGLSRLAEQGHRRAFPPGSQLMRQGDVSDSLHIILQGRVRVVRSHPQILRPVILAELGAGEIVGEMGVLDHEPRSATVTALNAVETLELDAATLAQTIMDHPEAAAALLQVLSRRVRSTDELVEQLAHRERPGEHSGRSPDGTSRMM